MYGRYTKDLGEYAKSEASRVKKFEKLKVKSAEKKLIDGFREYKGGKFAKCFGTFINFSFYQNYFEFYSNTDIYVIVFVCFFLFS